MLSSAMMMQIFEHRLQQWIIEIQVCSTHILFVYIRRVGRVYTNEQAYKGYEVIQCAVVVTCD